MTDLGATEFRVSSLVTIAATVAATTPPLVHAGGETSDAVRQIGVTFTGELNPIDVNAEAAYELRRAGSGGFGSPDDVVYVLTPSYAAGDTSAVLAVEGLDVKGLPPGTYRFTIFSNDDTSLHDLAGLMLDGDANGAPGGDYVRVFTVLPPRADVNVQAAVSDDRPIEGATVTYTVIVDNAAGPQPAHGLRLTDLLPAGLTLLSHAVTAGAYAPATGAWDVGSLAVGGSAVLTLTARVNAGTAGQTITNTAAVSAADQPDPVAANNTASAALTVRTSADLALTQTLDTRKPIEGQVIHYTVTLTNEAGPYAAHNVRVTDALPARVTFVSATPSVGGYDGGVWSVPTLAIGATATLVVAARVNPGAVDTVITNVVSVTADEADPDPSDNARTLNETVERGANIRLAYAVNRTQVYFGQSVQLTLTATNLGPNEATDLWISAKLDHGLILESYVADLGLYRPGIDTTRRGLPENYKNRTDPWIIRLLPVGATATLVLNASVYEDEIGFEMPNDTYVMKLREIDLDPDTDYQRLGITVIERPNAPPEAVADSYDATEDAELVVAAANGVLANDRDDDLDPLTATLVQGTQHGQLSLAADGSFRYTPAADFHGTDGFTYRANDGTEDGNVAAVTITVAPVNDAPSFTGGGDQSVPEDAGARSVPGWATGISAGPPNEAGQVLTFVVVNDNLALFAAQPAVSAAGVLTYEPASNAHGTATVRVRLRDDGGGTDASAEQTFTITVTPVNDSPVLAAPGAQQVAEDGVLSIHRHRRHRRGRRHRCAGGEPVGRSRHPRPGLHRRADLQRRRRQRRRRPDVPRRPGGPRRRPRQPRLPPRPRLRRPGRPRPARQRPWPRGLRRSPHRQRPRRHRGRALNDAPVLDAGGEPALTPIPRDSTDPRGDTVAGFAAGAITDPDAGAVKGVAVVAVTGQGDWQYSRDDGQTWVSLADAGLTRALLLRDTDRVRFVPSPGFVGTPTIRYHAWDQSGGEVAPPDLSVPGSTGGTTAFSNEAETARLRVAMTLTPVPEDSLRHKGDVIRLLLGDRVTDADPR